MRVLLISKAMTVPVTHGKARLLGAECELTLVIPYQWPGYASEQLPKPEGFVLERLPIYFPGHNHLHFYKDLGSILAKYKPDLVHIDEEPYSLVTTQAMFLSKKVGAKAIAFTWQNIFKKYPPPFAQMERYVYKNAPAIIAGNQEAAGILRAKGYSGLIPVIPQFGIDLTLFSPQLADKSRFSIDEKTLSVAYVGRLAPEKGVDTLIQAAAMLDQVMVYIVGTGPAQRQLEKLVLSYQLGKRVRFLGGLPSTEVPVFMASVDVLVLPSRTTARWKEQFGRVLVEAMASGTAVVGSNSGEIPHVIGDAGLVFAEGDAEDLAAALQRLQEPSFRFAMVQRGLERAKLFSQERIVQATLQVYRQVLEGDVDPLD
jgi:glycosyltransferase involved in cell wall biosynthesis